MIIRLGVCALALACALAIFAMVASESKGLDAIMYEDLTCEELIHSYNFNINVLQDMMTYYDGCMDYVSESLDGHPHGELTCSFIREHGLFVQGIVNDIAAVFNIKCVPPHAGTPG